MDCRDAARFVQLRLDDEIEPLDCALLDRHLETCSHCQRTVGVEAEVQHSIRAKLQVAVESNPAPPALAHRIAQEIACERRDQRAPVGRAFAACLGLFAVGALTYNASSTESHAVDETVTRHSRHLPPEVRAADADREHVDSFLRANLAYPVAAPRFERTDVPTRLVGARLSNIQDRDVAYMMYDHRGARLSVFAYPDDGGDGLDARGFHRRRAGARDVYVGQRRGYNVVSWKDRGMNWSMVSDVDPGELVHLVKTTY